MIYLNITIIFRNEYIYKGIVKRSNFTIADKKQTVFDYMPGYQKSGLYTLDQK